MKYVIAYLAALATCTVLEDSEPAPTLAILFFIALTCAALWAIARSLRTLPTARVHRRRRVPGALVARDTAEVTRRG